MERLRHTFGHFCPKFKIGCQQAFALNPNKPCTRLSENQSMIEFNRCLPPWSGDVAGLLLVIDRLACNGSTPSNFPPSPVASSGVQTYVPAQHHFRCFAEKE
jgi:hypothetical protein